MLKTAGAAATTGVSNLLSHRSLSRNWQCSLHYRIHKTILVKILRKSLERYGCQASRSLDQVTIGSSERTTLRALVDKTKLGEGDCSSYETRQDNLKNAVQNLLIITEMRNI